MTKMPNHGVIKEAFSVHFALRELGFNTDEIAFVVGPSGKDANAMHCFCEVIQKESQFLVDCGKIGEEPKTFLDKLEKVAEAIQSRKISERELRDTWRNSYVRKNIASLVATMKRAGFVLWRNKLN